MEEAHAVLDCGLFLFSFLFFVSQIFGFKYFFLQKIKNQSWFPGILQKSLFLRPFPDVFGSVQRMTL